MKTTIRVLAAAAMLAVASTPAFAQGGGGGGAARQAQMRAMMYEGITLTDAQKAKIDSIDAQAQKARTEMRASMGDQPDRAVMMQKNQEIMTKQRDEIKKVLTADQVKLFEANLAKMPQGRGRGGR